MPTQPTSKDDEPKVGTTDAPEQEAAPTEPYVDPYKQILNPLELPANPAAAAAYTGDNVSADAPISEEKAAQAREAIQAEKDKIQEMIGSVPEHPADAAEAAPTAKGQKAAAKDEAKS